jgi:hypothetical protein
MTAAMTPSPREGEGRGGGRTARENGQDEARPGARTAPGDGQDGGRTGARPARLTGAPGTWALKATAVLYIAGYLIHSADHVARGLALTPPATFWLGTVALLPAGMIVALALLDHRLAPALAVLAGTSTAVAASLIHLPPPWSVFSEPFRTNVGIADWLTLVAMVGSAVAFAAVGAAALRARRPAGWLSVG